MKQSSILPLSTALMFAAGFLSHTQAQTYSIDWFSIDSGGGRSAGGLYQITGTIGQPDASASMTNSIYSLTGGFWSFLAVVQTSGSPPLTLTATRTNTAVISWPSPSVGFTLQQNTTVAGTNWTDVGIAPSDDGATKNLVVPTGQGNRYYRLKK